MNSWKYEILMVRQSSRTNILDIETGDTYQTTHVFFSKVHSIPFNKTYHLLALDTAWLLWSLKVRDEFKITPRSFIYSTSFTIWVPKIFRSTLFNFKSFIIVYLRLLAIISHYFNFQSTNMTFIINEKRGGLRYDPWGTPEETVSSIEI